jgi:hypothetical protein
VLRVYKGEFLLPFRLQFLFVQHGRLKHITQPLISKGCNAWNGYFLKKSTYGLTYDTPNLKSKLLIPNFLNRDPYRPITISFGLLCLLQIILL